MFKDIKKIFILQIVSFLLSSIGICLAPFGSFYESNVKKVIAIFSGVEFWLFFVFAILLMFVIKKICNKNLKGKPGIISVFKNKYAKVVDVIAAVSLIGSVAVAISKTSSYLGVIILFVFIFSVEMHCVLNGRYFNHMLTEEDNKNE